MKITLLAFGMVSDHTGRRLELQVPEGSTLRDLKWQLESLFPRLAWMDFKWARNEQMTEDFDLLLQENDTIALIPPFSGG
jgi:molybdopterin converting factor small subunit